LEKATMYTMWFSTPNIEIPFVHAKLIMQSYPM
jgi:hypothetical protein